MFQKRCHDMMKELQMKYSPDMYYICQDCPRDSIWRLALDPQYKANRNTTKIAKQGSSMWGRVFDVAAQIVSSSEYVCQWVDVAEAEADDCIAVVCSELSQRCEDMNIQVITGDSDLYQLESIDRVTVFDRKGHPWKTRLHHTNPDHYIQAKCYSGDSADHIPSVGNRIGIKTALGWVSGSKEWPKNPLRINQDRLELNKKLILLSNIPKEIQDRIRQKIQL